MKDRFSSRQWEIILAKLEGQVETKGDVSNKTCQDYNCGIKAEVGAGWKRRLWCLTSVFRFWKSPKSFLYIEAADGQESQQ